MNGRTSKLLRRYGNYLDYNPAGHRWLKRRWNALTHRQRSREREHVKGLLRRVGAL